MQIKNIKKIVKNWDKNEGLATYLADSLADYGYSWQKVYDYIHEQGLNEEIETKKELETLLRFMFDANFKGFVFAEPFLKN